MAAQAVPFIRRKVHTVESYDKKDLVSVLEMLARAKRTGALKIHLTNGAIGAIEFDERERAP